ncbi:DUF47 family protein [Candidatus Marsarchaeota archaeon]|jgi:uncharacterized protein Yka (UPF0111/DUF47 family)|nr:DUF47 family protein [Candidatus Marsarchaeota archaeon]MCL5089976.1 DUF47 family protein [Candidatus Marsarchaeota archaeon]
MKFFDKLLNPNEKSVMADYNNILKFAEMASDQFILIIDEKTNLNRIKDIEKECDEAVFDLKNNLMSGGIAPNVLVNMLGLADTEDDIIDFMYILSKEFIRYKIKDPTIEKIIKDNMRKFNLLFRNAISALEKMQSSGVLEDIKKFRIEIENYERLGDDIKDKLIDLEYNNESLNFKDFHFINEVAHKMDDALDSCEDSSDEFLAIMSSITT